ncbi:response regulator [Dechloromonas hortensis]|uniref:response regulator n=1 Tax=Dechloromonas hortensis TaxID=337779 RepID=UPI0012919B4C|nr:response regulator [Dechloromonas hortensis]
MELLSAPFFLAFSVSRVVFKEIRLAVVGKSPGLMSGESVVESEIMMLVRRAIAGAKILLVEDNPVNQEVALFILEDFGLHVDVAENGSLALARLQAVASGHYDLIFMDMQMPVMDGLTATQEIRKNPDFGKLPIVAMTANVTPEDRQGCFQSGMNDFVSKPIFPEELAKVLLRWIPPRAAGDLAWVAT